MNMNIPAPSGCAATSAPTRKKKNKQVKKILLAMIATLALSVPVHAGGWFLMLPPPVNDHVIDAAAPLSDWYQAYASDSAYGCQRVLAWNANMSSVQLHRLTSYGRKHGDVMLSEQGFRDTFSQAQCVPTEDARLHDPTSGHRYGGFTMYLLVPGGR
jgi:hypothetical protein